MIRMLLISICVLVLNSTWSQSNKQRADGGMSLGVVNPMLGHRYDKMSSDKVLEFARNGSFFSMDAHVGLGSGWKAGIYFNVATENLNDSAFADFLLSTLDTAGYYVTRDISDNQYYQSRIYAAQLANDIELGHFLITPQIALGITNANLSFQSTYLLKEIGTNYWRKTEISNNMLSGIDLALKPGIKAGYWIDISNDRCLLYMSADFVRYKSIVGLNYKTTDVFQNTTQNTQWKDGIVSYLNFGVGITYYIMPDPMVVQNSDKTRKRTQRKSKSVTTPVEEEFD